MPQAAKKPTAGETPPDALPMLVLVVDADLGIQEVNDAARELLGPGHEEALCQRSGDVFHCAHRAEAPAGCGRGKFCQICPIREAATQAQRERRVVRRRTKAEMGAPGQAREVHLLVTATPLPSRGPVRTLLVLEDISALIELQDPVPICAYCKRLRDDDHYWQRMEGFFQQHLDLDLSQGVCPECKRQLYGDIMEG